MSDTSDTLDLAYRELRRARIDNALMHTPGDSIEETLAKDHWVREKLRGNCPEEISVDVLPNGEGLPKCVTFSGKVGIGEGRFIQVDEPVTFWLYEHVYDGVEMATYSAEAKGGDDE